MKKLRVITLLVLFLLVGFYINAIQPKALKNAHASQTETENTGTPTNTQGATSNPTATNTPPAATNTSTPTGGANPTDTVTPTCIPLPLCFYSHPSCELAMPIGRYCPAVTATATPTDSPTPTDGPTATPTNGPTSTPTPSLPAGCTPITVYLNGIAVVACQEQLQHQDQSINFNPVINNNPTNNNNNNNTNNNNINLANNNGQVLGAVYNPSSATSLPGTGAPTVIWEVLGGITPLGFMLRKIANK